MELRLKFFGQWKTWLKHLSIGVDYLLSPGPVAHWKSVLHHPHAMFWLHAYGRFLGSLHVLWPQNRKMPYAYPKGFHKVHVRAQYGFLWISYELGNTIMYGVTVRARSDAINGFPHIISAAGPYRAR